MGADKIFQVPGLWLPKMGFNRFSPARCCCDPISCEDTSRPKCYVDKNVVGGAGDGTTWEDAYTLIQDAIDDHGATHRIYIKGHGSSDPYDETLVCVAYTNLIGINDVYISSTTG